MRKLHLVISLLILVSQVGAYSIFVSPSNRGAVEVERGEEVTHNIYLTSDTEIPLDVRPAVNKQPAERIEGTGLEERLEIDEYSDEESSDWISFSEENFQVTPEVQDSIETESGGNLEVNGIITYTVDVPQDAEPGYHRFRIKPDVRFDREEGEGASIRTMAISSYGLLLEVPGDANRELTVTDVEALRSGESSAVIRATLENTGTVSVIPKGNVDVVSSSSGERIEELELNSDPVPPGESVTVETTWSRLDQEIQAGNYRLRGNLNYVTGSAFIDETVSITDFIQIEPSTDNESSGVLPEGQGESGMPLWLVAMFLITTGSLMYSFDIDPLLILLFMGVFTGSAMLYFSSLPSVYIVGVLIVGLGSFYYGWLW